MSTLWSKKNTLNPLIQAYTAGDDPALDLVLLPYDILGSIAHAQGLGKIGVLTKHEVNLLTRELGHILELSKKGKVMIRAEDEDCHTFIENAFIRKLGSLGKKIHTGRSRNDQILTALRLYMKEHVHEAKARVKKLIQVFEGKAKKHNGFVMPGYTHMQRAMPSSAGLWLGSFADALKDDLLVLDAVSIVIDQSPLGSVVGYGEMTLGLNRKFTARKLGFSRVQKNPLYAANSRGKFELLVLQALQPVMFDIGKFATDTLLFSTKEFGFLSLPSSFTTGSSAMPQKRNCDVLELMRANTSLFTSAVSTLSSLIDKLPSGYNRDFQLSKKVFIERMTTALSTLEVAILVVEKIVFNRAALESATTPELFATEEAYRMVKAKHIPFRDAYHEVAKKYKL